MSEHPHVRALDPDELRASTDLFRASIHHGPTEDRVWELARDRHLPGRTFGAFEDSGGGAEMVGTAMSFPTRIAVPGGAAPDAAAVSLVGVRADRTRRGHLRAMMGVQLADAAARGEVLASLTASEAGIYGRYGYGIATRGNQVRVRSGAAMRAGAPGGGSIRMLALDRMRTELPRVYEGLALNHTGGMTRPDAWWDGLLEGFTAQPGYRGAAVHTGRDGTDDGYVFWGAAANVPGAPDTIEVRDLHAADPAASADLWRFVLGIDLATDVTARKRALDEDLSLLLEDPRLFQVEGRVDETWLRLLDVPAALSARTWGEAAPVVLRVRDALFPANDGPLRIGPDGPKPVEGAVAPDLECDVDALAMAYLGDRSPSELVTAGWWTAHDPAAVERADALFATPGAVPWCGTFF